MPDQNQNGRLRDCTWDMVAKRLESKARNLVKSGHGNCAILHISIYVNDQGRPIGWTAPGGERLEPRGPWLLEDTNLVEKID